MAQLSEKDSRVKKPLEALNVGHPAQLAELEFLYKTAPIGLCLMDKNLRFIRINKMLADINGKPIEEHIGRSLYEIIPEIAPKVGSIYRNVIETGEPVLNIEVRGTTPAEPGKEKCWLTSYYPLKNDDGTVWGVSTVVQDITDFKRVEERFHLVIESAPNGLVMANERGKIILVNSQAEKLLGYTREELIGQSVDILVPERFRGKHTEYRKDFYGNPQTRPMGAGRDLFALRKDGTEFPVEIGLTPIQTEEGLIVLSSIVDVTQRKRAEEKFRLAVESAPNAIVMANQRGETILVNSQTEKLFGYSREELIGQSVETLVPERFRDKHPEYRMDFHSEPQARPMGVGRDLYALRKDGSEFPVEIGLTPIQTEEGVIVLSAIIDISERKQMEEALIRRTEQVIHYQSVLLELAKMDNSDLDSALKRITEADSKTLGVERVGVWLFNKDHSEIVCKDLYKLSENFHEKGLILKAKDYPNYFQALEGSRVLAANDACTDPRTSEYTEEYLKPYGITSMMDIPVRLQGKVVGIVCHEHMGLKREWTVEEEDFAASIADMVSLALEASEHKRTDLELQRAFSEIKQLKDQLERENIYLRQEIKLEHNYEEIIGKSLTIKTVLRQVEQVANTNSTVLIIGETGTGKELLARAIHNLSKRKGRAMVKVNCGALPSSLIESELFGREKGAYTGALSKQIGRFELANGSTIFLDEISELPLELQSKLLRVLQEGQFERLGSPQTATVDVRVIAATNRDLAEMVREGKFRSDLYYRLNVFPIKVPSLRERKEDIPYLVWNFVKEYSEKMGKKIEKISKKNMEALQSYPWPGNVRELRNIIERAMILTNDSALEVELPLTQDSRAYVSMTLEEFERNHIMNVLETIGWRIRGKGGAAEILGLKPSTLESKMQKLGIKRQK